MILRPPSPSLVREENPVAAFLVRLSRGSGAKRVLLAVGLALAAAVPYFPFLSLPFISDDYGQIFLSRQWGPMAGWPELAGDALYRCRATSLVLTHWIDGRFGLLPLAHNAAGVALHVMNTFLVLGLGWWKVIGFRISAPAAIFFGVYEGHQEAVIWNAAAHELLVFLFFVSALICWVWWLRRKARNVLLAILVVVFYLLALLSKESAVSLLPILGLVLWLERPARRGPVLLWGFLAAVSVVYVWAIFQHPSAHQHLNDGTFTWRASFWFTLPHSMARMLWIWGLASLVAIAATRAKAEYLLVALSLFWMAATLLPYSFLTYMSRVPSRHTYLASAGLALLAAAGYRSLEPRLRARRYAPAAILAAVVMVHNCGFLWIKKIPQYQQRAAVTERFLAFAAQTDSTIEMRCLSISLWAFRYAALVRLNRPPESVIAASPAGAPAVASVPYCDPIEP